MNVCLMFDKILPNPYFVQLNSKIKDFGTFNKSCICVISGQWKAWIKQVKLIQQRTAVINTFIR